MKPTDRQKMCVNCDGRVPFEAIACPYCSADLAQAPEVEPQKDVGAKHQAIQDSLTALYTPPYQQKAMKNSLPESKGKKTEPSKISSSSELRHQASSSKEPQNKESSAQAIARDPAQEKTAKSVLLSILTLSIGSLLFVLGILQVFFSEEGVLRLEWNANGWFIYCLAGLPLLYYGYRQAEQHDS